MTNVVGAEATPTRSETGVCAPTTVPLGGSAARTPCCCGDSMYVMLPGFRFCWPSRSTAVPALSPPKSGTRKMSGPLLSSTLIVVPRLIRFVAPGARFCQTMLSAATRSELRRCSGSIERFTPRSEQIAFASVTDLPTRFGTDTDLPRTKKLNQTYVLKPNARKTREAKKKFPRQPDFIAARVAHLSDARPCTPLRRICGPACARCTAESALPSTRLRRARRTRN